MRRLLTPPVFPGEAQTQQARMFHTIALSTMVIASGFLLAMGAFQPELWRRAITITILVNLAGVITLAISRTGRTRLASWILLSGLAIVICLAALNAGGIRSAGIMSLLVFVMMAGLLLGQRAAVLFASLCFLALLGLVVAEATGRLPVQTVTQSNSTRLLQFGLYFGVVLVLLRLANSATIGALRRAEQELTERRTAEAERDLLVGHLGERVKELRLLHNAARLLQADRPFGPGVLDDLVAMLPPAFVYPESSVARIAYADFEATTPGWRTTPWVLRQPFGTGLGGGVIEVAYLEEHPAVAGDPFLAEERAVMRSLAEILEAYISHHQAERRRSQLEHQLRQSQKMEALGTLVGGIAHDFNNLLAAIGANLDLALADTPPGGGARTSIEEIANAHARATALVKRILLFSRRQESERQHLAVAPVIEEAVRLLRASIPSMIRIHTSYGDDLPTIFADPSQLHQVVMNLGTNAAHAMLTTGGDLSIVINRIDTQGEPMTAPTGIQAGEYLCITVSDTGTGMSTEILDRLFEPFFTTKGNQGTGLGLSVVHGIVREHGAQIAVESEVGRGTTIRIWFTPVAGVEDATPIGNNTVLPGHGQHIMYVDDEEALVFVMTRILQRLGYRSTGFSDSGAALHAFRTAPHDFDVVITDFAMPAMTGVELARTLRTIRADIPIVLATGYGMVEEAVAPEHSISVRLQKPIPLAVLSRTLAELVGPTAQPT